MASGSPVSISLMEAFGRLPDPRGRQGREHPLPALLAGMVVGFMAGANTVKAVVIFLRERPAMRRELGFTSACSPSQSTYHRLLARLDLGSLRSVLGEWLGALAQQRGVRAAAVDGKALRGTAKHVLHVFAQDFWRALDAFEVDEKKNEDSGLRGELASLCGRYPFLELFTFDAAFATRPFIEALGGQGRRGLFQIKANQPELLRKLERAFAKLPRDRAEVRTGEKK